MRLGTVFLLGMRMSMPKKRAAGLGLDEAGLGTPVIPLFWLGPAKCSFIMQDARRHDVDTAGRFGI